MPEVQVPSADFNVELMQGGMKAAIKESGATARDLLMVPVDKIRIVAGMNVRIHDAEYEEQIEFIKNSILQNGFYQHYPLPGFAGKEGDNTFIFLTGGFTRFEAARRAIAAGAPIEELPVVLKPPGTSMLDLTLALDIDNTSNRLKPFERAVVLKRAIGYGSDVENAATRMGITVQYANGLLYMMGLSNGLQTMVTSGKASAGHVIELARKVGPAEALKAFEASSPGESSASRETFRVRPRSTAESAGIRSPAIAKKTLFSAIDYAIALPGDGIKWLASWRKGDSDAVSELASYVPPRKPRKNAKPKTQKAKGTGKPGRPKKVSPDVIQSPVDDDPPL